MFRSSDWKNIEMTGYFKGIHGPGTDNGGPHIEFVMRGAWNSTSAETSCSASNYHMNIYYYDNGKHQARDEVHLEKDQYHTAGYSQRSPSVKNVGAGANIENKWFGWKTVVYNNPNSTVTIEAYIDDTTDGVMPGTFRKVFSFTDSTGAMGGCKGLVGSCVENDCQEPVTYGGPIVNFRWDQMASMQFKWLSVREIVPPTTVSAYSRYKDWNLVPGGSNYGLVGYHGGYNPDLTVIGDMIGSNRRRVFQSNLGYIDIPATC
jgi:hypothetical protein